MNDEAKTKEQLINELTVLRQLITELEEREIQHKQTEETLHKSEESLRHFLDDSPLGIRIVTAEGETLYSNRAILDTYGYDSVEELKTTPRQKSYTPESYAEHQVRKEKRQRGEYVPSNYEISIVRKNGEIRHLEVFRKEVLWNGKTQFQVLYNDITTRKEAEEALQESMIRYKELAASIGDVFFAFDTDLRYIYWNRASEELTGISAKDALGKHLYDIFPKDEQTKKSEGVYLKVLKEKQPQHFVNEYQLGDKHFFFEISAYPTNDGLSVFVKDATNRRLSEEELRKSETKYRTLAQGLQEGVYQADLEGNYITLNMAGAKIFGFDSPDQVVGKYRTIDFYHDLKDSAKIIEELRTTGHSVCEVLARKRDGTTISMLVNNNTTLDERGNTVGYEGIFMDTTERKKAEENEKKLQEEISVSSRLASIGELASGVAHEINNPLTAVVGFSQMLMARDIPEDAKEYLKIIDENAQRVAKIVKNLLTFARQRKPGKELIDVNPLISRVIDLRGYEMKTHNVEVTTEFAPDLPSTMADDGQLQQVFLNIILNAEQAMMTAHNKGDLLIRTEWIGNRIRISFKDDGPGIASENLGRIFDPFFTTKPVGEGTGLGLSLSYGIIKAHKGKIYAESTLGQGATFVVELPIVSSGQPEVADPAVEEPGRITGARIMIVDDEPAICQLLSEVLTADGHNVETVDNAGTALERLELQRYSLILLDVQMAGMDGIELYKHMGKIASSLQRRVIFITGDTMTPATQNFLQMAKVRCISKPFDTEQLKKEINQILLEKSR